MLACVNIYNDFNFLSFSLFLKAFLNKLEVVGECYLLTFNISRISTIIFVILTQKLDHALEKEKK